MTILSHPFSMLIFFLFIFLLPIPNAESSLDLNLYTLPKKSYSHDVNHQIVTNNCQVPLICADHLSEPDPHSFFFTGTVYSLSFTPLFLQSGSSYSSCKSRYRCCFLRQALEATSVQFHSLAIHSPNGLYFHSLSKFHL